MATTYGEQLLEQVETRARSRGARRRRLTLLVPGTAVTLWAMSDLLAARHGRLSALDAGFLHHVVDHTLVIGWTVLFVLAPLAVALKPRPTVSAAGLTLIAGPILSPIIFGNGGWHFWQTAIVILISVLILGAGRARRRT